MYKIFISLFLLFFSFATAYGDITISPLKHEITIEKGTSKEALIIITNNEPEAVTLYSSKEDFIANNDTGHPTLIKPQDLANPELSLTNWVSFENESITLAANESKQIKVQISAPETAESGGHYGAIFYGTESKSGAQLSTIQRLGVLLLITVPGEIKIAGEFGDLETGKGFGTDFSAQNTFTDFPISFSVLFNNSGNTHIKPRGKIELIDENGDVLKKIGKEKIVTDAGAVVGEKVVDYIPVNEELGNTLPDSSRRYISEWKGFGYKVRDESTGENKVLFKGLSEYYTEKTNEEQKFIKFYQEIKERTVTKPITANYHLYFDTIDSLGKNKEELRTSKVFYVTYQEKYIGYNTLVIGMLIFGIFAMALYFIFIRPKHHSKKEDELRKKIMEEMKNNQ
ncbi:MAG: DUF916 domain-containing protein [Candidatus Gracilibacteria bacterium]|nr:DUF916 domain-containing protein [Candidatus Gracilibacteria bacterium]